MAVPPRLTIPDSNVNRVLSDGFSKNITICFPASEREKTDGRDFISSARCSTASTPSGPRSRVETKSGHQKTPGNVSGITGVLLCNCVFNVHSSSLVSKIATPTPLCARDLGSVIQLGQIELRQCISFCCWQNSNPPDALFQCLATSRKLR